MMKSEIRKPDTFLYFAYGDNMVKFRMKMFNPSAEFVSIARVDNYRLDFNKYVKFWGGPVATLVPTANAHVWGVIWRLHRDDLESLDHHNGIEADTYFVRYIEVLTPYMGTFRCRTYLQTIYPLPRGNRDPVPTERWPSWGYKEFLIIGARQHGLPQYYIRFLRKFKDNGDEGCIRSDCLLVRYGTNQPCLCRVPGRIPRKPLKLDLKAIRDRKLLPDPVRSVKLM
ncbi:gamma-glutamylcyclotransferase-like [Spodoptera litura]|uniref:gamma-glutamylcyclotransferase n=1 Tax=Spodoptera litura TaxID=69820 RepID=A0A9J7E594_SPOLT|nr:gamma-glutamylcyclotransferase-like [Spodoptera litura]